MKATSKFPSKTASFFFRFFFLIYIHSLSFLNKKYLEKSTHVSAFIQHPLIKAPKVD